MTEAILIYLGIGSVLVALSSFFVGRDGYRVDEAKTIFSVISWPFLLANTVGAVFGGEE